MTAPTTPSNVGADASRGHTPDAPPIVLELWAYGAPNSGYSDPTVLDRAADTITELLEALDGLLPDFTGGLDPTEPECVVKARAAIAKARTPAGETK